ncbi:MAG TPA: hypothetical protein DCE23_09755, partial [Firmicutes bacterium]|nr:hypothetical protein [Bacillota bacterium]
KKVIDNKIYQVYKDNYTYSKVNNVHIINDYYSKERSKLMVKRNYLCLKSTNSVPEFLKAMKKN